MNKELNNQYYSNIEENKINSTIIEQAKQFAEKDFNQIYLINKPLGGDEDGYDYEDNCIVLLSPKHKIIFLDLKNDKDEFDEYYDEFIEDLGSISKNFKYKNSIGRPKEWKDGLTCKDTFEQDNFSLEKLLKDNKIEEKNLRRKCELLITLLIGSINDISNISIEEPATLLEKIKQKIVLFDGEQTRFIYKEFPQKVVNIQGLSGTGKTELLLHKLKEIYTTTSDKKIFFTCHNKVLASNLRQRIPDFFNFMKVQKQIEWDEYLWVTNAWGSTNKKNSGLYSYICHHYNLTFHQFNYVGMNFKKACQLALDEIKEIASINFKPAFDYILIDESQDFPQPFFDLCEKVTSTKIYIAGDIFQNIFENGVEEKIISADLVLNACYRTDSRTLMFAQAIGMGLFEKEKLNWLSDQEWQGCGYNIKKNNRNINLYRQPIRRFEDIENEAIPSVIIENDNDGVSNKVIEIIANIKSSHPTVKPDDIAIIFLDSGKYIYELANKLEFDILDKFSWEINKGYKSKTKIEDQLFISNANNVKGLEFPFVICVTKYIASDAKYRNTFYTMLTRSFIQSYLLVNDNKHIEVLKRGLTTINTEHCIKTTQPTEEELIKIHKTIIEINAKSNMSYNEFLYGIFNELNIELKYRNKFEELIPDAVDNKFDEEKIKEFINVNKDFYCK